MAVVNLTAGPAVIDPKQIAIEVRIDKALAVVRAEVLRAMLKHAPMHSSHEAFGVIYEEFVIEFGEAMKANDAAAQCLEIMQTGAMCVRALCDVYMKDDANGEAPKQA